MAVFRKFVTDLVDYKVAWDQFLGTDNIVSARASAIQSSPLATSAGTIRIASQFVSANNLAHVIFLSAGTIGNEYQITSTVTTSAGRRKDFCFTVRVEAC